MFYLYFPWKLNLLSFVNIFFVSSSSILSITSKKYLFIHFWRNHVRCFVFILNLFIYVGLLFSVLFVSFFSICQFTYLNFLNLFNLLNYFVYWCWCFSYHTCILIFLFCVCVVDSFGTSSFISHVSTFWLLSPLVSPLIISLDASTFSNFNTFCISSTIVHK